MKVSFRLAIVSLAAAASLYSAQSVAQSSPPQIENEQSANEDPDRLICRGSVDTGSLVKGRRQCFTRAQWERMAGTRSKRSQGNNRRSSSSD